MSSSDYRRDGHIHPDRSNYVKHETQAPSVHASRRQHVDNIDPRDSRRHAPNRESQNTNSAEIVMYCYEDDPKTFLTYAQITANYQARKARNASKGYRDDLNSQRPKSEFGSAKKQGYSDGGSRNDFQSHRSSGMHDERQKEVYHDSRNGYTPRGSSHDADRHAERDSHVTSNSPGYQQESYQGKSGIKSEYIKKESNYHDFESSRSPKREVKRERDYDRRDTGDSYSRRSPQPTRNDSRDRNGSSSRYGDQREGSNDKPRDAPISTFETEYLFQGFGGAAPAAKFEPANNSGSLNAGSSCNDYRRSDSCDRNDRSRADSRDRTDIRSRNDVKREKSSEAPRGAPVSSFDTDYTFQGFGGAPAPSPAAKTEPVNDAGSRNGGNSCNDDRRSDSRDRNDRTRHDDKRERSDERPRDAPVSSFDTDYAFQGFGASVPAIIRKSAPVIESGSRIGGNSRNDDRRSDSRVRNDSRARISPDRSGSRPRDSPNRNDSRSRHAEKRERSSERPNSENLVSTFDTDYTFAGFGAPEPAHTPVNVDEPGESSPKRQKITYRDEPILIGPRYSKVDKDDIHGEKVYDAVDEDEKEDKDE